jgi:two-component system KDP operon response regulator KdpE
MPAPTPELPRILVVDDELAIRRLLALGLDAFGYVVDEATSGEEALRRARTAPPSAVVLDLGLPDMEGTEVIGRLREWSQVPIVVLSVRDDEAGKIAALDGGADDYVTKPFSMGELMARIRVAIRRHADDRSTSRFEAGALSVDLAGRNVALDGAPVRLTPKEYDLLRLLVLHAGRIVTHRQLLAAIWPESPGSELQKLRVLVGQLRRKLEPDPAEPRYIIAEPGIGYRMEAPSE